jgi:hypothetical protein
LATPHGQDRIESSQRLPRPKLDDCFVLRVHPEQSAIEIDDKRYGSSWDYSIIH